jgi:hypothetical protein
MITVLCGPVLATVDTHSLDFEASNTQWVDDNCTGWEASYRSITAAAWVKFESTATSQAICGTDYGNQKFVWYWDQVNTRMTYMRGDGSATPLTVYGSTWSPTAGEWVCLVLRHDQTTAQFYANNSSIGSAALANGPRINSSPHFYVGCSYASWAPYYWLPFDGEIAGLIICVGDSGTPNYVLSDSDLTTLYASGVKQTPEWSAFSKIKRLYTMEEGTGSTTTNGYGEATATLGGVTGTPTWTEIEAAGENVLILVQ